MEKTSQFGRWGGIVVLGIAAAEVIIMSSPFAGFFYATFGFRPLLGFLSDHGATAWLNSFFLPNSVVATSPLLLWNRELGLFLLALGLWGFVISAAQVYGNKMLKRGVAKGLLYRVSRHPQYLCLAIAGYGLLAIWPRFLLLVFWIVMLFLYAFLSRFEEERMREKFGDAYQDFRETRSSFVPGSPVRRLFEATFGRMRPRWLGWTTSFVVCLGIALSLAFALRAYSVRSLYAVDLPERGVKAISVWPAESERIESVAEIAASDRRMRGALRNAGGGPFVAWILPLDYGQSAVFYRAGSARFATMEGLSLGNLTRIFTVFFFPTQGYTWGEGPLLGQDPGPDGPVEVVFARAQKPYKDGLELGEVLDAGVRPDPVATILVDPVGKQTGRFRGAAGEVWGVRVVMPLF